MYSPILKIILFTLVLYKTTEAAVGIYPPQDKPPEFADQEGCYLSSLELVLEVDIPYSPQDGVSCERYVCKDNEETQVSTCGVKGVNEGCEKIEGNKTLPYPECCDIVRCTNEDGTFIDF